jgi:hypothetical protein
VLSGGKYVGGCVVGRPLPLGTVVLCSGARVFGGLVLGLVCASVGLVRRSVGLVCASVGLVRMGLVVVGSGCGHLGSLGFAEQFGGHLGSVESPVHSKSVVGGLLVVGFG